MKPWLAILLLWQLVCFVNGKIQGNVVCRGKLDVYTDKSAGESILTHQNTDDTSQQISIDDDTQYVSIKCDSGASSSTKNMGIMASFTLEIPGDYITDGTWKCNGTMRKDWTGASFEDTAAYAVVYGDNGNQATNRLNEEGQISDISTDSKWIWTESNGKYRDQVAYCRGKIGISRSYDNYGRKFVIGFMQNVLFSGDTNNARDLKFLITTLKPTNVTVFIRTPKIAAGASLYENHVINVKAGSVSKVTFPYDGKLSLRHDTNGEKDVKALLVMATDDIKIVGENQDKHSTDLFLALALNSIGLENDPAEYYGVCWDDSKVCRLLCVSGYDNTQITITPGNKNIRYDNVNYGAGQDFSLTLGKFDSIQFNSDGLTGTKIQSNKPLAVYSGNQKTAVKYSGSADHMVEQLLPLATWGKKVILPPLKYGTGSREASSSTKTAVYQILAANDNTKVTIEEYNQGSITPLKTPPQTLTLNKGDSSKFEPNNLDSIAVINATDGISVVQFATTKSSGCLGDPWMQVMPPTGAYEKDYAFLLPVLDNDGGKCKPVHYFSVVIKKDAKDGLILTNEGVPMDISQNTYYSVPGTDYVETTIQINQGEYRIRHEDRTVSFALNSYGYGYADSYGNLGGVRTPPLLNCVPTASTKMGDGLDNDCDGSVDEENCAQHDPNRDCATPSPVDGKWSDYKNEGICICATGTTINGKQKQKRTCDNPVPQYNGLPCSGESVQNVSGCTCTKQDGGWEDWDSWGSCDTTCGDGLQIRVRKCTNPEPAYGGIDCVGSSSETKSCSNANVCPVHGGWSVYKDQGDCSCPDNSNDGEITKKRACDSPSKAHGGRDCSGSDTKVENCTCPQIDGVFSEWSQWICTCVEDAYVGNQTRSRQCNSPTPKHNGKDCEGDLGESVTCDCVKEAEKSSNIKYEADPTTKTKCKEEAYQKINADLTGCLQQCGQDSKCKHVVYQQNEATDKCLLMDACEQVEADAGTDSVVLSKIIDTAPVELDQSASGAVGADPNEQDASGAEAQTGSGANVTIVAGAVGGAALLALLAGLIFILLRRRKKKKEEEDENKIQSVESNDIQVEDMDNIEEDNANNENGDDWQ